MPTAAQFEQLATRLDRAGEQLATTAGSVTRSTDPTIVQGTPIATLVQRLASAAVGDVRTAGIRCDGLASLCRERARVCRRYDEEYREYLRRRGAFEAAVSSSTGGALNAIPPTAPVPPAPWVERSV